MRILFGVFSFIVIAVLLGGTALAIGSTVPLGLSIPSGPSSGAEFLTLLENITDWIFAFAMIGAIIFIVLAGFQFISSGGDPNAVGEARRKLLYAAIGIAIAVMSRGIPVVVRSIIGT
jgi:hypothetical protein